MWESSCRDSGYHLDVRVILDSKATDVEVLVSEGQGPPEVCTVPNIARPLMLIVRVDPGRRMRCVVGVVEWIPDGFATAT